MKKKSRKWLKISLIVIGVIILGIGTYAFSIYNDAKQTVNKKVYEPIESIDREVVQKKVEEKKPLNILLLGVDARENDSGRSDALMVLSLDPSNDSANLVSIPRDTRTEIVGKGTMDKINHAYAFGGPEMSIATVENMLDIELDYFVRINMEGLAETVDVLGGITIDNEIAFNDFAVGEVNLNGAETLEYVRMRKQDPRGDFGRTERQRKVIQGIIDKGANLGSVGKISDLMDVLGSNMATKYELR
ncbi:LCP family glycopolymer transferase [Radiobacillus deserti]|uniref:LCP family glycopolymer transferase n=1 Tax=Radiobacillus deserti TaxID=2594883 RepID=UPI002B20E40F|nr:LCP family protein [Radiobacillus deserti]